MAGIRQRVFEGNECTACSTASALRAQLELLCYAFFGRFSGWQGRGGVTGWRTTTVVVAAHTLFGTHDLGIWDTHPPRILKTFDPRKNTHRVHTACSTACTACSFPALPRDPHPRRPAILAPHHSRTSTPTHPDTHPAKPQRSCWPQHLDWFIGAVFPWTKSSEPRQSVRERRLF